MMQTLMLGKTSIILTFKFRKSKVTEMLAQNQSDVWHRWLQVAVYLVHLTSGMDHF